MPIEPVLWSLTRHKRREPCPTCLGDSPHNILQLCFSFLTCTDAQKNIAHMNQKGASLRMSCGALPRKPTGASPDMSSEASPRIGTNEGSLALHVLSGVSPLNPILHDFLFLTGTEVHKGDSLHRSKKSFAPHFLGVSPHILSGASPRPACLLEPRPACQMELRSACLLELCPYKRKELRPACPLEPRPAK